VFAARYWIYNLDSGDSTQRRHQAESAANACITTLSNPPESKPTCSPRAMRAHRSSLQEHSGAQNRTPPATINSKQII